MKSKAPQPGGASKPRVEASKADPKTEKAKPKADPKKDSEGKRKEDEEKKNLEKRKKEEDARREEAKLKEDEEKRKQDEESKRKTAQLRFEKEKKSFEERVELRKANIVANTRREALPKGLDASMKKTGTFIRKLKMIGDQSLESLLGEWVTLNLSKYVTEVVNALVEAKLNVASDVTKCVRVSSAMHQRYAEFASNLLAALLRLFGASKGTDKIKWSVSIPSFDDDKNAASKLRSSLRLLTELYFYGVTEDPAPIIAILLSLMRSDNGQDPAHTHLSLLVSFARYGGEDFLGIVSRLSKSSAELAGVSVEKGANLTLLSSEQRNVCRDAFDNYFGVVAKRLQELYLRLRQQEKKNARAKIMKGEVPEKWAEERVQLRDSYDKLQQITSQLADALDKPSVQLPDDEPDEAEDEMTVITMESVGDSATGDQSLFEDEDTRTFYEDLPNLRLTVLPVLLDGADKKAKPESEEDPAAAIAPAASQATAATTAAATSPTNSVASPVLAVPVQASAPVAASGKKDKDSSGGATATSSTETTEDKGGKDDDIENLTVEDMEKELGDGFAEDSKKDGVEEEAGDEDGSKKSHPLELLLQTLPSAFNRDAIDKIAEKFCSFNTKAARKRLVKFVFGVHRSQLDLLPYYSRLVATLAACLKDIGTEMVGLLRAEFYRLLKKKDQLHIESKIRNIKFLAELTKFRVCPTPVIFKCWHACLLQFTHHQVHIACALLETCGRWLYRNPETHLRTVQFLDRMMKLKESKFMDKNLQHMIENAYFQCKPPITSAFAKRKERSVLHTYIRKCLYDDLTPSIRATETVLKRLRKLNWDPECTTLVLKCLCNVSNVKYSTIPALASVAAGLSMYHAIGVLVVDAVVEEIRVGLERNDPEQKQRRTTYVKYLGELYNFRMFDSQVIFDTLYLLITFGHVVNKGQLESQLDPPSDTFRVLLVSTLLETCGHYFDRGSSKRRLDRFLCYFQRYIFWKEYIPIDLEFTVADLFDKLRPKMKRAKTLAEIAEKIVAIEQEEQAKVNEKAALAQKGGSSGSATASSAGATPALAISAGGLAADQMYDAGEDSEDEGDEVVDDQEEQDDDDDDDAQDKDDGEPKDDKDDPQAPDANEFRRSASASSPDEMAGRVLADVGPEEGEDWERDHKKDVKQKEDEDFISEFDRMLQESVESRKYEKPRSNLVPVHILTAAATTESGTAAATVRPGGKRDADEQEHIVFRLVTRNPKGAKQMAVKDLLVPMGEDIARSSVLHEQQQREEKADLKRYVLEGLQREEKEAQNQPRSKVITAWGEEPTEEDIAELEFRHRNVMPPKPALQPKKPQPREHPDRDRDVVAQTSGTHLSGNLNQFISDWDGQEFARHKSAHLHRTHYTGRDKRGGDRRRRQR